MEKKTKKNVAVKKVEATKKNVLGKNGFDPNFFNKKNQAEVEKVINIIKKTQRGFVIAVAFKDDGKGSNDMVDSVCLSCNVSTVEEMSIIGAVINQKFSPIEKILLLSKLK